MSHESNACCVFVSQVFLHGTRVCLCGSCLHVQLNAKDADVEKALLYMWHHYQSTCEMRFMQPFFIFMILCYCLDENFIVNTKPLKSYRNSGHLQYCWVYKNLHLKQVNVNKSIIKHALILCLLAMQNGSKFLMNVSFV